MASLLRNLFSKSNASEDPQTPEKMAGTAASTSQIMYTPTPHSGYTITTGRTSHATQQEEQHYALNMVHIRANVINVNMDERWVSAEDAMLYMDDTLTDLQIQLSIGRLMGAAYIKAQWPPNKAAPNEIDKLTFVAVAFDNLYLLFDDDAHDWESAESKKVKRDTRLHQINTFISDMEHLRLNPASTWVWIQQS